MSDSTVTDPYAAAKEKLDRGHPRSWIWDEDGDEIAGYYKSRYFWTQKDGSETECPALIKHETGFRAVWLFDSLVGLEARLQGPRQRGI